MYVGNIFSIPTTHFTNHHHPLKFSSRSPGEKAILLLRNTLPFPRQPSI